MHSFFFPVQNEGNESRIQNYEITPTRNTESMSTKRITMKAKY